MVLMLTVLMWPPKTNECSFHLLLYCVEELMDENDYYQFI